MLSTYKNAFFMDFENSCLMDWKLPHFPKGNRRHEDPEWAELLKYQISKHSDISWEEYKRWVEDGGGDEWFIEVSEADAPSVQDGE